jgi:glycerol-1-phosphate dehydrogenase [NAD(P)+]
MRTKLMHLPRSVLVGADAIERSCDVLEDLKIDGKALIVADKNTYKVAGERLLDVVGENFSSTSLIISDATGEEVNRDEKKIAESQVSFTMAVGGGRVIDVTKLAAKNRGVDFISVPTAAAHDGIASSRASIKRDGSSVSIEALAPNAIIADTKIIQKAPYRLLASGCGDIISKYTSLKDWELGRGRTGEEYSEYAAALSMMSAKIVLDSSRSIHGGGEEGVRKVVKALISCGVAMSIAGSSRPASGSEHKFSHALDIIAPRPALHGEQCGVGSIMMMKLYGGDWKKIKKALSEIGAPTTAAELGIESKHIVQALLKAREIRSRRYTILDEVNLSREGAEQLARETDVID